MSSLFLRRARKLVNASFSSPKPLFTPLTSKPIFCVSKPSFTPKPLFSTSHPPKPLHESSFWRICRPFSTSPDPNTLLIKVVCHLQLDSFSKSDFEQACLRISRRFPLLSREDGSRIRRTVAVEDRFHHSRHFLFVSLGFVDVGRLELLISTISTDLVGLRGEGKLLIFDEGLLAKKEELAVDCGLIPEDVIYVDLEIPDESLYFHPLRAHFKEAVNGLIKYLTEETYCKKHLGNCLTFLYALIMRGAIFTRGKGLVEVALVKAASKVEAGDMLDDEMLHVIDLVFKARLVFRFKSLSKRAVATKAWEMAKAGYDKEEYFDEEKFEDEEEEATARWAWDLGALPLTKTSLKNELKKWDDGF